MSNESWRRDRPAGVEVSVGIGNKLEIFEALIELPPIGRICILGNGDCILSQNRKRKHVFQAPNIRRSGISFFFILRPFSDFCPLTRVVTSHDAHLLLNYF